MISADPVYQILKGFEQKQEAAYPHAGGVDPRDFRTVMKHIYEAGYIDAGKLTQAGQGYIQAYERRLNI
ncbi:hypothetical protein A3844_21250 [Paenibacillus helianthi]|uniref:Uncharacterized protein n=1 Tax=Paenibacillus helianthi TaxID=1349432 RepID=A0ABX3EL87_9BACL|nr:MULTISPECIES: hypothetical protein [Paenibacillus]OKP83909.1 hypothetical protein A3844_21250 [Paenibacillus helianthi]OKP87602.1 hypothetical protein A3848_19060 [Paenibacillus sp. P32E]